MVAPRRLLLLLLLTIPTCAFHAPSFFFRHAHQPRLVTVSSSWTEDANDDEAGARIWLPTPTTSANLGAVGDFGTTTVRPEIFQQEGNFWVWAYRDPETGAVVAEEKYRVAEVDSASEGGTRLKIDIAAREGGGGSGEEPWETYHRVDMDLGDALEMHEDLDDEPHWDFRGFYRRRDPEADGEATQAAAAPAAPAPGGDSGGEGECGADWVRTRGASDVRKVFESRFNLLRVRQKDDPNFKLELSAGSWRRRSEGGSASSASSGSEDDGEAVLFSTKRIDGEEWVKTNGEEMWCTHRAWVDTGAWHLRDADSPLGGLCIHHPNASPWMLPNKDLARRKLTAELSEWCMEGLSSSSSGSGSAVGGEKEKKTEEEEEEEEEETESSEGSAVDALLKQARDMGMTGNVAVDALVEEEAAQQKQMEEALEVLEAQKMLAEELGYASIAELEAAMDEIEAGGGLDAFLAEIDQEAATGG